MIPHPLLGDYNPYKEALIGDWFVYPDDASVHAGDVYLNGRSFNEAKSVEEVKNSIIRDADITVPLSNRTEYLLHPDESQYQWFPVVDDVTTTIYANFHGYNPNREITERNVLKYCFNPEKVGMNYITVRGFEMSQAATPWVPPTGGDIHNNHIYIDGNVYLNGADSFDREEQLHQKATFAPNVQILEEGSEVYLELTVPQGLIEVTTKVYTTDTLGTVRLVDAIYDDPIGQPIIIRNDFLGIERSHIPNPGS